MFDQGITSNWGSWYDWGLDSVFYISPVDSGWADGTVFVDQVNYMWGVEMKAYLPQAALHSRAGFNMGGATATPDTTFFNYPENAYAYFCWHPQPSDTLIGYPVDYLAGDIMRRAKSFGTIRFELTTTGIKPDYGDRDNLAKSFVLHQNYPNPFNPETQIKFTLDQGAHVKLDVYDILGRKVTTLVDGKRLAGGHSVTWSADDLASGVYFYRLSIDDKPVSTKKAILMR
ncbi:MAG: T9SS type A sorting domain-containing protein, partial [Aliifodinibius sp.]|nr:T9SS type A sorting domain-containing protein [Fodinibius sp.]